MRGRPIPLVLAIAAIVAGGWLATSGAGPARAQETPATLAFAPSPAPLPAGGEATYVLGITGAQRLFGADIEIDFDPAAVSVVDADPVKEGTQVNILPFLDAGFVVFNVADNTAGKIRVTYTQVAPKAAANGDGGLISLQLKAKAGGDPKLRVSAALLARQDGSPQPVTLGASGATPAPPSASLAPNPTVIPTAATTAAAPSVASGATTASAAGTAAIAPSGPGPAPADDSSTNWTLPLVLGGVAVAAIAAVVVGRRYLNRNGETQ